MIKKALRNTDVFAIKDKKLFLILSATPVNGVDFIIKAIRDFFKKEVAQVYVSYPKNGDSVESLLSGFVNEMEKRYAISIAEYFS